MTQDPKQPTPPGEPDTRRDLVDAVVGDNPASASSPSQAEPATAGVESSADTPNEKTIRDSGKKKNKKAKPEPTTFGGKLWHSWIKPIGTVFLCVAVLRSTIIDWNDVPSGSMEPTILVGDRILVNKMAYALQIPLSGPKIGVPFTAWQWDNPLDGLPSWQWGRPVRGDIVTFWNPVTGVRMVKRIVAEPGDTIELRGGVMTITPADGSPTTATYVDTTTFPANQTIVGKDQNGNDVRRQTQDAEETLLGETRTIQHIRERWYHNWGIARLPDGKEVTLIDGVAAWNEQGQALPVKREIEDEGVVYSVQGPGISESRLRQMSGGRMQTFAIRNGVPFLDGEAVDYNAFAAAYLKPIADRGAVAFGDTTIGVVGHDWQMNGEPASSEQVQMFFFEAGYTVFRNDQTPLPTDARQQELMERFKLLRSLMTSSFGPVTLGDDAYYMIGDNRNNSTDSRYFGPVRRSEITGEAIAIPVSFHGRIRDLKPRWSRWFHGLD